MDIGATMVRVYHRQFLLNYRYHPMTRLHDGLLEKLRELGLLREPSLQSSGSCDAGVRGRGRRKRCARKQKRGKRAGVRVRLKLNGLPSFHDDSNATLCGKARDGGLCVYINPEWCKNSVLVSSYCSSLVKFSRSVHSPQR